MKIRIPETLPTNSDHFILKDHLKYKSTFNGASNLFQQLRKFRIFKIDFNSLLFSFYGPDLPNYLLQNIDALRFVYVRIRCIRTIR